MIQQIEVLTHDGNKNVNVVSRGGLSIHKTLLDGDTLRGGYTVTHSKTGCALIHCRNLRHAKYVMEKLNKIGMPWELNVVELSKHTAFEVFKSVYHLHDIYARQCNDYMRMHR